MGSGIISYSSNLNNLNNHKSIPATNLSNLSVAIFNYSKIFHIAEDSGIIYT